MAKEMFVEALGSRVIISDGTRSIPAEQCTMNTCKGVWSNDSLVSRLLCGDAPTQEPRNEDTQYAGTVMCGSCLAW